MHRQVIQTFLSTAFRSGVNVYSTPRLHFHLMKHVLFCKSPSLTAATEERTDFSDLSSEEFGTLRPYKRNTRQKMEELPEEEDERIEFDVTNEEGRKNRKPKEYYEDLIEKLLAEKKMVEALDVLETRILKKDRIAPWYRVYNLLINGCAKVGYFDKAFELYRQMKVRHIKVTPATYTGLFNAVANSPFQSIAKQKLTTLRKTLAENGVELTTINYHALIKAYARLNDPYAAFLVADEMVSKGHAFTSETCSFLLQACISDTEAGLRHALLLWHKMRSRNIKPDAFAYNLLFRCIRDCGFGTENDLQDVLRQINVGKRADCLLGSGQSSWSKRISWKRKSKTIKKPSSDVESETNSEETKSKSADILEIKCEANDDEITDDVRENESEDHVETLNPSDNKYELTEPELVENKPNLLATNPHLGNIIAVKDVKTASDRLLLLGGFKTVLEQMNSDQVQPNIKTFTIMLDVIPATDAAEELLLKEMKNHNVLVDIDFYNMLIKKRAMRHDYEKAKEVLNLIQRDYLQPDIVTFGVLAVSCNKMHEAEELVYQLRDFGYRLNMPILGAMLAKACSKFEFDYILFVMKTTLRIRIKVSEEYLDTLENFNTRASDILKRVKRGDKTVPQYFQRPKFLENYRMWKKYYQDFRKEIDIEISEHPYQQFQKVNDDPDVKEKTGNKSQEVGNKFEKASTKSEKVWNNSGNEWNKSEEAWNRVGKVWNKSETVGNKSEFARRRRKNVQHSDRNSMQMKSES